MKESRWWWWWCRSRSCRNASRWRPQVPFVALTHSRTFHKTRPDPRREIENLRPATTPRSTTTFAAPGLQTPHVAKPRLSIRFYSQSSSLPNMAEEVKWTGLKVRKTFFDFFAERGHTIGM